MNSKSKSAIIYKRPAGWGGNGSTYFFVDREERLIGLFLTQLAPSTSYPLRAQFRGLVYQAIVD